MMLMDMYSSNDVRIRSDRCSVVDWLGAVFVIPGDVLDPLASLWSAQTPFQISPYIPDPGVVHTIHLYVHFDLKLLDKPFFSR